MRIIIESSPPTLHARCHRLDGRLLIAGRIKVPHLPSLHVPKSRVHPLAVGQRCRAADVTAIASLAVSRCWVLPAEKLYMILCLSEACHA